MKWISLLALMCFTATVVSSQNLPNEMYYSSDGRILYSGGKLPTTGFYNVDTIKNVYLNFEQTDYWSQLTANYQSETNIAATMIYDGVSYPGVGVRFRGNTSYMQIGNSPKKSFAIETDFTDESLKIDGYNDFKFNNAHQDPSFMREVLYSRMARKYIPIAKANYIHLFLNGQDWGIYPNIQAIDKSFLEEWFLSNDGARFRATKDGTMGGGGPGWGDGTAGLNYLGNDTTLYQRYYTLKSNDKIVNPWQTLIDATYVLSQASVGSLDDLKTKFDVDKALWFLACENIFTDDDSYVMKGKMDYMVYIESETGRTTPLEYDGNSTFLSNAANSVNWGPFKNAMNVNYPLLNKLLNIPEYRQRYLAHYRTILEETFTISNATQIVNGLYQQINQLVASDSKKLYSTNEFNTNYPGLISFVTNRRNYLLANAEVKELAPKILSAKYVNQAGLDYGKISQNEPVNIKAELENTTVVAAVNLYFGTGLTGSFSKTLMYDDGNHQDGTAADGIYGAEIPGMAAGTLIRYYVEAIANNSSASASYLPAGAEHDIFVYSVESTQASNGVVINEIMAQNTSTVQDENGDFEDWVELYNTNDFDVDLSGFFMTDDSTELNKWALPDGTSISAKGYLIIWADEDLDQGAMHADFKLSAGGEMVFFSDTLLNLVDKVVYGQQTTNLGYARIPNGTGSFVIQHPTFGINNETPSSTSILSSKYKIFVSPNPAHNFIIVEVPEQLLGERVTIYDQRGNSILVSQINTNKQRFNLDFQPGIYWLKCGITIKKLIIH